MDSLSTIREPDGVTLDLSDPVRDQISDGVLRLVAEAAPGRAAASTSPTGDEGSSAVVGEAAQPSAAQLEAKEDDEPAAEPASASTGPVEAPAAKLAAKKEDEGARKPLLSDDCCTCYACNISVPYKEMMSQHMMSEGHIHNVAVFYGLKPP